MLIKVSLTALCGTDPSVSAPELWSALSPHASAPALGILRQLVDEPAAIADGETADATDDLHPVELDDSLGTIVLDPALDGHVELDPSLMLHDAVERPPAPAEGADGDASNSTAPSSRPPPSAPPVEPAAPEADVASAPTSRAPAPAESVEQPASTPDDAPERQTESASSPANRPEYSEKKTSEPTLDPFHALVDMEPSATEADGPRPEAVESAPVVDPDESTRTEEIMVVHSAPSGVHRAPRAQSIEEEAAMTDTIRDAEEGEGTPGARADADPPAADATVKAAESSAATDDAPSAAEAAPVPEAESVEAETAPEVEAAPEAEPVAAEAEAESTPEVSEDAAAAEPVVDENEAAAAPAPPATLAEIFAQVPDRARHFMALLSTRGAANMPEVMAQLGLVRAKGVGGAIEPIQRMVRAAGIESPFSADFDGAGFKRWNWNAEPLSDVPAEALEPLPPPPPQAKKPKAPKKAVKSHYKPNWKKRKAEAKAKGKGRKPAGKGGARKGGKPGRKPGRGRTAAPSAAPGAAPNRPSGGHRPVAPRPAPQSGAGVDESRTARPVDRSGPPAARRRRFDRPMPEVVRRANRPAERPPAERRRFGVQVDESDVRRQSESRPPIGARSAPVPRLDRGSDAPPRVGADADPRKSVQTPEERPPLPRSGVFRRRTVSDTDVPVVVIRRRKR